MKIFKKIAAAVSSVMLLAALCTSVSAEEVVGFDYAPAGENFVHYDFTAEDGATGTLTYTKDEDGKLYFSSYKIDSPALKNSEDFPNYTDPDGDYQVFLSDLEFFNYLDELSEKDGKNLNYVGIVSKYNANFSPPSDSVISMRGSRYYIADVETMTVSYAGYYAESVDIAAESPECTAEDGTKFRLNYDYDCWGAVDVDIEPAPIDYVIDHVNKRVSIPDIDTGYPPYDGGTIPTNDNEFVVSIEIDDVLKVSEQVTCYVKGERVYVIDKLNDKARYVGYTAEYKYIEYDNENNTVYCIGTTEDGANYSLALDKRENGEFEYSALMIDNIPPEYDITESGDFDDQIEVISWRDDVFDIVFYYFDSADIELSENELLISIPFDINIGSEVISLYKHYIITLDGENSTVRYYCMSFAEDSSGTTTSPNTGNGGGYLKIMLAAAGMAFLAKYIKK